MTEASVVSEEFSDAFSEAAGKKAAVVDEQVVAQVDGSADEGADPDTRPAESAAAVDKQADDPYAGLAPEVADRLRALEEQNQQLEHRLKSDAGRVAAYQRQVGELQAAINSGQKAAERAGGDTDKPDIGAVAAAMKTPEKWAAFTEEYPEIAEAIDDRLTAFRGDVEQSVDGRVTQRIAPVEKMAADAEITKGYEYLDSAYVGWKQRVGRYDAAGNSLGPTPEYQEWIDRQRPEVRAWADSDNVEDAESLIQLYDTHLLATGQMSKFKTAAGQGPQNGESSGKVDALARKRQQQLEDGDSISSRGAGVGVSDEGPASEFGSAFAAFAKRKEREQQRA